MKQKKIYAYLTSTVLTILFSLKLNAIDAKFLLGLENIPNTLIQKIQNARIALITNQTGKDQVGNRNIDILRKKNLNLTKILVPEHGLNGVIPAGQKAPNSIDKKTGIPIVSLYQKGQSKKITKEMINDIDVLVFDIQDSGMRHYTYISTMFETLSAAGKFDKYYIVLDRPNPLGPVMEGPLVEPNLHSFVSIAPIPIRHGLTVGELAWFFNQYILKKPAKLHIIKMKNYNRKLGLKSTSFTTLSPNISSLKSCHGYSFLGIISAIYPFDVGLKTNNAFQIILLPERISPSQEKWKKLQHLLKKYDIGTNNYKRYHSKNNEYYTGLKLKIPEINNIHSFTIALDLINFFKNEGIQLKFAPIFDKLIGIQGVRHYIQGKIEHKTLAANINADLQAFFIKAKPSLMYNPSPKPIFID